MRVGATMLETIALAEEAIQAARPAAEADPFRPVCHFRPPAQWMNDICGALYHEGYYHIFYQFNPFADRCDWGDVNPCWGHARSRDLVHWEHLPIALAPSKAEGNRQCVSGSAIHRGDGTPMLFYGHTPDPGGPRQQWAALPLDPELRTWRTLDVGLAPGKSGVPTDIVGGWTDMFVFREAGRTFAIFKVSEGLVVEAQNPELTRWQAVGRIAGVHGECPNFIKLQDRWLLLRSTYPMTYQVGTFDPERIAFDLDGPDGMVDHAYGFASPPDVATDPDYYRDGTGVPVCRFGAPPAHSANRGFYATSVFADAEGRTLLLGWVGAFEAKGWNCCMSLPRVLSLDGDDRLIQTPIPELAGLRERHTRLHGMELHGDACTVEGITSTTLEVMADIALGTAQSVELRLRDQSTGSIAVRIAYDGESLDANGTLIPRVLGADPRRLTLHLFFDRSLMELFINEGRQTVTRVAYPSSSSPLEIECCAIGATAQVTTLDAWELKASWPTGE